MDLQPPVTIFLLQPHAVMCMCMAMVLFRQAVAPTQPCLNQPQLNQPQSALAQSALPQSALTPSLTVTGSD